MKKRVLILVVVLALALLSACSVISVKAGKNIVPFLFPTGGATVEKDGTVTIQTDVEDNRFSYMVLQLYSDAPKEFIENITTSNEGKHSGVYTHENETGSYILTLKANSNKQDEGIDLRVFLIKGETYVYSYDVKSFNETSIVIKDIAFGMK